MRAVVCHQGQLSVQDVSAPEPGVGEVLLRVRRAGICGSDLHARLHGDETADVAAAVGYDAFMRSEQSVIMGHEFVGEVLEVMRDLAAQGMTMIVVTHEMAFARDVADRVVFMAGGVVVEEGTAEQVITRPQNPVTARFVNAMQLADA